jgi:methylmalonyl-CoA mutase
MKAVERAVEAAILQEFREIDRLGGVLPATEQRYQRSQIQQSAHRYEQQIYSNTRPIIGLNRFAETTGGKASEIHVTRTPRTKKQLQVDRLKQFKRRHAKQSGRALDELAKVVESGGNVFEQLIETVRYCSLGQITARLQDLVGRFRPTV